MSSETSVPAPLITRRLLVFGPVLFIAALYAAHTAVLWANRFVSFDCPRWWPFSVFNPRSPGLLETLIALCTAAVGCMGIRAVLQRGCRTGEVAALGILLVLATNAIQGIPRGFTMPISGGNIQYYHDARASVVNPLAFVRDFNRLQPRLRDHSRTHPPGAVLVFDFLRRLTGDRPALMSILLAVCAVLLTAFGAATLAKSLLPGTNAGYFPLLLLLLPAVQIYYCATLDALIASLLLAAVALWAAAARRQQTFPIAAASAFVAAASFLTFAFVWVIPVLGILSVRQKHLWGKRWMLPFTALIFTFVVFYGLLWAALGFDYLSALRMASRLENPNGFRLIAEPVSYLFTRLENITELGAFCGPFLLTIAVSQLNTFRARFPDAFAVTTTATLTLFVLFLTGAYRTGETARACLFIYPYLLLPVAAAVSTRQITPGETNKLACLVWAQSLLMQVSGAYFW